MKIKKRNLIIIAIYFIAFLGSNIFLKDGDLTIPNLFIACFSILLFAYGFDKFCSKINAANTFLTFFYLGLALNCLSLSGLQTKKEFKDIYFYFVGPLIFFATLRIIESIKFKKIKIIGLKIKGKYIAYIIFGLYIVCKCYLFKTTGIKLLDSNFNMSDNNEYAIAGFTGICNMLMLMSLMLMQEGKKLYKVIVTCVIIVFECLFMVSRGQIIKVSAFLLMYFLLNQNFINTIENKVINIFTKKNKLIIGMSLLIIIIAFSYMGQYRQAVRSNGIYNIMNVTQLKINSVPLAWIYSYYPFNFEVLRLYYQEPMKTLGYPSTTLMPIIRLVLNDSETYLEMFASTSKLHINGFNAATFLSRYIMDLGYFYFLELIMLGIYIGFIEKMAIYNNCKGVYAFILSLMLLYTFGEYSMVAYYIVAILFTIFLYSFIIKEENDGC